MNTSDDILSTVAAWLVLLVGAALDGELVAWAALWWQSATDTSGRTPKGVKS
jgi:hypothetical protein